MLITVIDYGSGNLRSATKAFEKAAAEKSSSIHVVLTRRAEDVRKADRIVLPGQGAFADCMKGLAAVDGMIDALEEAVIKNARPFFGICVGMQLLATRGLEHGVHQGLNWIPGEVRKLAVNDPNLKIPHMGWNTIRPAAHRPQAEHAHPLLKALPPNPYVYFVHSYAFYLDDPDAVAVATPQGGAEQSRQNNFAVATPNAGPVATASPEAGAEASHQQSPAEQSRPHYELAACDYGGLFTAAVVKDNIAGTQFHPEKSQKIGLQLVRNFLDWAP